MASVDAAAFGCVATLSGGVQAVVLCEVRAVRTSLRLDSGASDGPTKTWGPWLAIVVAGSRSSASAPVAFELTLLLDGDPRVASGTAFFSRVLVERGAVRWEGASTAAVAITSVRALPDGGSATHALRGTIDVSTIPCSNVAVGYAPPPVRLHVDL